MASGLQPPIALVSIILTNWAAIFHSVVHLPGDHERCGTRGSDRCGLDDLFLDYGTNVPLYPKFQAFFRERKPPTLIVWGKNDKIFPADGATPYLRDLPDAELHLIDTGHFALEDRADVIVPLIRDFLCRKLPTG